MSFINEFENYIESLNQISDFRKEVEIKIKQMNDVSRYHFYRFKQSVTSTIKDLYLYLPMFITDENIEIKLSNGDIVIAIIESESKMKITYRSKNDKMSTFDVSQYIYFNKNTDITNIENKLTNCITQIIKIDEFINGIKK